MKKQLVYEEIFAKRYEASQHSILFGDLPKDLLPTDTIAIEYDEGYYSDNNSWDPFTKLHIFRNREETDAEFEKRKVWWTTKNEESRTNRYKDYLKLKQEFEEGLLTRGRYIMSEEEKEQFERYSNEKFNIENG